jgi:uncharacterized protein (DUF1778 family)
MYGMADKTQRIEARLAPDRAERIRYASSISHTSLSAFVVEAAAEKAERVIAESSYTTVPDDYFDALLRALDEPAQPIAALRRAAERATASPAFTQKN